MSVATLNTTNTTSNTATSEDGMADRAAPTNPAICRYFLRGICRFGALCRFSHDFSSAVNSSFSYAEQALQPNPSTSRTNGDWANAPVFVPSRAYLVEYNNEAALEGSEAIDVDAAEKGSASSAAVNKSWADVVGAGVTARVSHLAIQDAQGNGFTSEAMDGLVCPYESPCPYGLYCVYGVHLELCEMCDQFCLHPRDQAQRRKHNQECLQHHEQAMELSFAIARSKDKTCGICFDTIMEKSGREKRFGILPNCAHIFCLECIRKWRQAKQFEHKITRSCPECRVSSDFVCPSAFWVETKEEKDKLLSDYRSALGVKDCKYFKKGDGKCPFGNKCFYKHALPSGELVDVGLPKRSRKIHRSADEVIDLLDIYLWEFVDHRDYQWLDLLSSASDDSDGDDSDWSEE